MMSAKEWKKEGTKGREMGSNIKPLPTTTTINGPAALDKDSGIKGTHKEDLSGMNRKETEGMENNIGTQTLEMTEQQETRKGTNKKTKNNEITGGVYCCNTIMRIKKNNVFINITKLNGQTIIKYSTGLIQKKKNKKQLRTSAK
jgi:hypothetical protein